MLECAALFKVRSMRLYLNSTLGGILFGAVFEVKFHFICILLPPRARFYVFLCYCPVVFFSSRTHTLRTTL